ncbi:toll/interleukin-1 receptor domain-containing protein [candidate division KSB1 bacterium]|nr:toll/interleukin-1 receptor domain-containing protein [candidate division KSB1 bacterium]NIR69686.1 toll/interleukin-1 receptor domain-containing protein [candidate division KSB1 bacterium]NIS24336.1 toll/interleukin-1 receptor domain-containing protein [candidate division KSB1 bacterium]NIT71264.1 toll/interleukin-1 receptor domain-containing protein [candidate division KSB1 bacterium]NIU24970.1 toll/interleukin-1 receptor domain-containing protein [candidate division KSB1 bacterium]
MKVFISHAEADEELAKRIADTLQNAGLEVWDHRREILPGDNWADKVAQALRESNAMVVLLTPAALHSSWVRREIEYALGQKTYSKRLIPVLVGPPEEISEDDVPWILRYLNMIRLTKPEQKKNLKEITEALLAVAEA